MDLTKSTSFSIHLFWFMPANGSLYYPVNGYLVKYTPLGKDDMSGFLVKDLFAEVTGLASNQAYSFTITPCYENNTIGEESDAVNAVTGK